MKNYETNNSSLVFVGKEQGDYGEELYLDFSDKSIRGWSFMGLRPETEESLRERARDTEPMDILGISREDFEHIERWFDNESFADDMEDDWLERHDSQAEQKNKSGETLYLGSGSGQDIFGYFERNNIKDFSSFYDHFEESTLTDKQVSKLCKVVLKYQNREEEIGLPYCDRELKARKEEMEALAEVLDFEL